MAMLVAKGLGESFDKPPPPKKKWIQDYLEKTKHSNKAGDVNDDEDDTSTTTNGCDNAEDLDNENDNLGGIDKLDGSVQDVIDQFQDYIHLAEAVKRQKKVWLQQMNSGLGNFGVNNHQTYELHSQTHVSQSTAAADRATMEHLLNPATHGTKFNNSLLKISNSSFYTPPSPPPLPPPPPPPPSPRLTSTLEFGSHTRNKTAALMQQDIGGVVQGVISSFLNGKLSQTNFRHQSRKRRHHHHEEHASVLEGQEGDIKRKYVVIDAPEEAEEEGILNLSLAKPPTCNRHYINSCSRFYNTSKTLEPKEKTEWSRISHTIHKSLPAAANRLSPLTELVSPVKGFLVPKPLSSLLPAPHNHIAAGPRQKSPPQPYIPTPVIQSPSKTEPAHQSVKQLNLRNPISHHSCLPLPPVPTPSRSSIIVSTVAPTSALPSLPNMLYQCPSTDPYLTYKPAKTVDRRKEPLIPRKHKKTASQRVSVAKAKAYDSRKDEDTNRRSSGGYTREMHNMMEKNRRAQLRQCFNDVARLCGLDPGKTSNLAVIRSAYKFIIRLRRREREQETELTELARQKASLKQRLDKLRT